MKASLLALTMLPVLAHAEIAREPGSVDRFTDDIRVFDESTSFEAMLRKREELVRAPAALQVKARVIGVRREFAITKEDEGKIPQDLVLNAGFGQGLSEGMVLSVARKVPVVDPYRENRQMELEVVFATIKIVQVQEDLAIARVEELSNYMDVASPGLRGVLVGDYVLQKPVL